MSIKRECEREVAALVAVALVIVLLIAVTCPLWSSHVVVPMSL